MPATSAVPICASTAAAPQRHPKGVEEMSNASKVWLITGSSRGFGAELVRAALAHGDRVIATARHLQRLQPLVDGHHDRARVFALDVTDRDAAGAAVDFAV